MTGCIQEDASLKEISPRTADEEAPTLADMNFDPGVGNRLFRVKGVLAMSGNGTVPYLLLNATLLKGSLPVCSTKYMMIEVLPGRDCSFDISKNMRIWPGEYKCLLEVSGPDGQMASEIRECRIIEPFMVEPTVTVTPERRPAREEASMGEEQIDRQITRESPSKAGVSRENGVGLEDGAIQSSDADLLAEEEERQSKKDNEELGTSEGQANETPVSGPKILQESFVGSITSKKYHRSDCRYAAKIKPENRIGFESEEEAKKQGYNPCKTCNP